MVKAKATHYKIDLIGFLDIISILNVIILLVVSTLALGIGVKGAANGKTAKKPLSNQRPVFKVITRGGIRVTTPVSFLMCSDTTLSIYDPATGKAVNELSMNNPAKIAELLAHSIEARTYLAVKPSCFIGVKRVTELIESTGSSIGMEPIFEEARSPWDIEKEQ